MTLVQQPLRDELSALPIQLTRFVGRNHELEELIGLVPRTRLVTLTGAGGSGKTRLAREVAARLAATYDDSVWLDLAPLADPALVVRHVATTLHVAERPGSLANAVAEALDGRRVLLVFDNCEHLVDASAALIEQLLRRCPALTVLATSREALGVPGETAWLVPSLARDDAIQLFAERAQSVLPAFRLNESNTAAVAAICERLDGIPLAIELAAARARVLSPDQIAERLGDMFRLLSSGTRTALPRHRTLRGAIDWSHALLTMREQVLLRRLSVFAGGFSLDAAEAICHGDPLDESDVLDVVSALVDKSLVMMDAGDGSARYRLLETVRQYAAERLQQTDEGGAVRERHAAFFLEFAEQVEPHLFAGAGDPQWLARVHDDLDNLRAVFEWTEEAPGRSEVALRLGWSLHWFWFATGGISEGRMRLTSALARSGHASALARARAFVSIAHVAIWQGDHAAIRSGAEQALHLLRDADDRLALALAVNAMGSAYHIEGNLTAAARQFDESLRIAESLPLHVVRAFLLYWRGRVALDAGDVAVARACLEEAVRVGRVLQHRPATAHPLEILGRLDLAQGDTEASLIHSAESLEIHRATDDRWGIARGLEQMARVSFAVGRTARGVRLVAAADTLRRRIATPGWPTEAAELIRLLEEARVSLGTAFDTIREEGAALSFDAAVDLALADESPHTAEMRAICNAPAAPGTTPPSAATPPALRVLALGPLEVSRHGALIPPSAWGSARPRELLIMLLTRPEGWTRDQVGLAFWPEASSAQVRNSFHVTLHRLRKALGSPEWVVLAGERYRLDPSLTIDFDAATFERDARDAMHALRRGDAGAEEALDRVLARYRGDFLDGEPAGDWHLEWRDRLQRTFVNGLLALGNTWLADERWPRAAEAFRRILARDELHEEAWRLLMTCHARTGEPAEAVRLYQRLHQLLARELQATPHRETTELMQRIRSGEPI